MEKDIYELHSDNEQLISIAERDSLTGVLNKSATEHVINRMLTNYETGVLLVIDVVQFKEVNQKHGYLAGDKLLCQIAKNLQTMFFKNDVIGRIDGDKFVIFIPISQGEAFIQARIEQMKEQLLITEMHNSPKKILIMGSGSYYEKGDNFQRIFARADERLKQQEIELDQPSEPSKHGIKMDMLRINGELEERDKVHGAYFVNYETFKSIYRFCQRRFQRIKGSVQIILLTINGEDETMLSLDENAEWMELLKNIIRRHLRAGDVFCQFSSCQYLIQLSDVNRQGITPIIKRVTDDFTHLSNACQKNFLLDYGYPLKEGKNKG